MARFPYCTKVTLIPSSAYSHAIRVWKISKRPLKFSTNPTIVFVYVCYCTSNCYINNAQTNVQYNCQYTKGCYFDVTLQHIRTIVVIQIRRRIFSSYEVLFPRGCYLIDDFGTSIGCSTTRRSKACPVQLVVWRHSFTRIISLRSRANLLQTDNDIVVSTPTLTAFFTDIIDMSPEWHSWFLMFFSTFFGSLIKHMCSTHRLSSFRDFIVPPSLSLCILRPLLIFTAVISFSKLTASWSEASHKETTTYLHGYTSVLTVSLLNIDITRNRRLRTVVNDTYWLSTLYRGQYKHRHRLIIHLSYYHCDITTLAANLTFLIWGTQPLVIAIFFNATW